jgi:signal peptidase I
MDPNLNVNTLRELWKQTSEQHWLPVQGISMLPMIHEGDNILISYDLSTVRRGDILVFKRTDGLVAHRVIRIINQPDQAWIYQTKGDNCTRFDTPLFESEVLGRVNCIRKNGREYDFTTLRWQFWNSLMAIYQLLLGSLLHAIRHFKQTLQEKIS